MAFFSLPPGGFAGTTRENGSGAAWPPTGPAGAPAIRPALLALLGLLLPSGVAQASVFCLVPDTADGFVALRAAPGPQGRMIVRMKAGDEVQILEGGRRGWVRVRHWPGDARLARGYGSFTEGHVARRFLTDCG